MDDLNDTSSLAEFIDVLGDFARWMRARDPDEEIEDDDDRYMGSDSDFSDHALGIDY